MRLCLLRTQNIAKPCCWRMGCGKATVGRCMVSIGCNFQRLTASGHAESGRRCKALVHTDPGSGATNHSSAAFLPPLPSDLKSLIPLILKAADNLERVQRDALERVETAKLGAKRENLTRELGALMVA